jgi:hypothetical protein
MFTEDFHDPTVMGDMIIAFQDVTDKAAVRNLEDSTEPIGVRLIRAKQTEIARVVRIDVAQVVAQDCG